VPIDRPLSTKFHLDKRIAIAIGLAILIATPIVVYYAMSYNSVNGSTVQIASVRRSVSGGCGSSWPFCNGRTTISSVTYYVEAHVWSYATSLDTRVIDPKFSLFVDGYGVSGQRGGSATFKPNSYLIYSLTFTTLDGTVANAIGQTATNRLDLAMDALVSAGMYQNYVTVSNSNMQTFSG
jgi:hypothetical protein